MKNLKTERRKGMKWGGYMILNSVLRKASLRRSHLSKSQRGERTNLQPHGRAGEDTASVEGPEAGVRVFKGQRGEWCS